MTHKPTIAVVGSIIYDYRICAAQLPRPGETLEGYGFGTCTGGKGANQAVAAARLGGDVCMIGRIGMDASGDAVLSALKQDGINCVHLVRDMQQPTATCLIHIGQNGENDIIVDPGANRCVSLADIEAARSAIERADILLLQNEVPLAASLHAIHIAQTAGVRVIFNPAPAKPLPEELFAGIAIFTPNETEAFYYTNITIDGDVQRAEAAAQALINMGLPSVIITMGGRGAYYASRHACRYYPAFRVNAVDTTAAGDAFCGGLAVRLAEGEPISQAITFACAAGAVCAMRQGSQSALGTRDEVQQFIQTER